MGVQPRRKPLGDSQIAFFLAFALVSPSTADSAHFECIFQDSGTESPYRCLSYIDSEVSTGRSFRDHLVLPLYFSDEETGPGREVPWAEVTQQLRSTTMDRTQGS